MKRKQSMTVSTPYQSAAITQMVRTYITQEIAYDRRDLVLTPTFNLIEQGLIDSMGILRLISFIEEQFGLVLEPNDLLLENFATIDAITVLIADRLAAAG
jgi:acyl carrier protein